MSNDFPLIRPRACFASPYVGLDSDIGRGHQFWFSLDQASAAPPGALSGAGDAPAAVGEQRRARVLIVDDSAANRMLAAAFVRKAGHEVAVADDGAGAIEQVAADPTKTDPSSA